MTSQHPRAEFRGARAITAPATWGQYTTWRDVQFFLPDYQWWFVLKRRIPVPGGLGLDAVVEAVGELVSRHEATRTCLAFDGEHLVQSVRAQGRVPIELIETTSQSLASDVEAYGADVMSRAVDHETELPIRIMVALCQGVPRTVLLGISHVVADVASVNLLAEELGVLMGAAASGTPFPPAARSLQPADVATAEQGEAGRTWTAAALEHLSAQLARIPASMFGPPAAVPAPRYRGATLSSDSLGPAVRTLSDRHRVSTSALLLAALAALLRAETGTADVTFELLSANRADRALRQAIGNLSQSALTTVTVEDGPFAGVAEAAADAALSAHRRARYDPDERKALIGRIEAARGFTFDLGCRFNDMWSARTGKGSGAGGPAASSGPAAPTSLVWEKGLDEDKLTFFFEAFGPPERISVKILADTARLPEPRIAALLYGLESALIALAECPNDISVDEFVGMAADRSEAALAHAEAAG